ncbi:MAG: MoaD/ThiS family protein [Planctomycetota bacterium]
MQIRVLAFAGLARRLGWRVLVTSDLPEGATVQACLTQLSESHPVLRHYPFLVAVDGEWASRERCLADGAELALIPPVSGG